MRYMTPNGCVLPSRLGVEQCLNFQDPKVATKMNHLQKYEFLRASSNAKIIVNKDPVYSFIYTSSGSCLSTHLKSF
jgi:hypothetical protein